MIEAMVQAGAVQTVYRRAGRGGTVLILPSGGDQPLVDWLFEALREQFRTIAPVLPPEVQSGADPFDAWLCSLIEGLGLERPAVVTGVAHVRALQSLVRRDPDRLGRLVLLQPDDGGAAGAQAARADGGHLPELPIRVVSVPHREDHGGRSRALACIVEILCSRPDPVVGPGI